MNTMSNITLSSPCDLFGRNARQLHETAAHLYDGLKIEKPDENKICNAGSLLGLLRLGIKKGDTIRFIGNGEDFSGLLSVLDRMAG